MVWGLQIRAWGIGVCGFGLRTSMRDVFPGVLECGPCPKQGQYRWSAQDRRRG